MNQINPGGLLWFDDDGRRTIQQKIAEAAQRYRERVGYEPTICQLNPAQATALEASVTQAAARSKRTQQTAPVVLPDSLKLVPSELIQPHCYLIGIAEGDKPRAATLPYRDDADAERAKSARKTAQAERSALAASAAVGERPSSATRRAVTSARRVHAVQPMLIAETPEAQPAHMQGKRRKAGARTPAVAPAVSAKADAKARPAAKVPVTAKASAPVVPASLIAAAPAKPAATTRRSPSAKQPVLTAPMLPLSEMLPEAPAAKTHRRRSSRAPTPGAHSSVPAIGEPTSRKRSA